ncbi:MAG: hypothetical protein IJC45_10065 [Clostridia bacterium]|nr:hypothetical protein [Clostridia bacterium]
MQILLSIVTVVVMILTSFFNGFVAEKPADLEIADPDTAFNAELSTADTLLLEGIYTSELAWLAYTQLDNGAIPMTGNKNGEVTVNPYFADIAALALLTDAENYADEVKSYMEWHFEHLNTAATDYNGVDGTIYDYTLTVENGKVTAENVTNGEPSYDSTDSYAATFLTVVNAYYEATADKEYIVSRSRDIIRIAEAMLSTYSFGLTNAKPDYAVKFLMDNCEVYEGALAAAALLNTIGVSEFADMLTLKKCEYAAKTVAQSIENVLWNAEGGYYEAGIFADGTAAFAFSWDEFYPCATAQLFPIIHGLIGVDTVRARNLYDSFCEAYNWENYDIPSEFCWGSNVLAAAIMGDADSVVSYMRFYALDAIDHAYPLYNADIARVALAAHTMLEKNAE